MNGVSVPEVVSLLAAAHAWDRSFHPGSEPPTLDDLPRILAEINRAGERMMLMVGGEGNR